MRKSFGKVLAVLILAAAGIGASGCAGGTSSAEYIILPPDSQADESAMAAAVLQSINNEREACLLKPLEWDETLAKIAREYAMFMANNNLLEHRAELGRGLVHRLEVSQVVFIHAGENIARGFTSAEEVVNGWMTSDDHCRNILCPEFSRTGIALAGPGPYWVQVFVGP